MAFRCKEFTVEDRKSTMPVGTDAMLLGAWTDPGEARSVLDIGTGCGILALMMAQKSGALIEAIEIDCDSAEEASHNFRSSPWSTRLNMTHTNFIDFQAIAFRKFDLVISNPPFFSGSLRSPHPGKNLAKHDSGLDLPGLIRGVSNILSDSGRFYLVVPAASRDPLFTLAAEASLYPFRTLAVRPVEGKHPFRLLAAFSQTPCPMPDEGSLTICGRDGGFTGEYLALTRNFHYF